MERKLDKKYRPKVFADVLGQDGTIKVLRNTLKDIGHEVMPSIFYGPFGSGKTTQARIYARAVLCTNRDENQEPCNVCESCKMFFNNTHPGYLEVDGANLNKVEDFRRILESTEYLVAGSEYRVFLIDECHMMSKASQNLFLNPLEEGIPGVFFFFCTTEYEKIIPTIQSRCVDFAIRPIPFEGIAQRAIEICKTEDIPYEQSAVDMLVAAKKGHFRDVLVFIGQVRGLGGVTSENVLEYLDIGVNDSYFEILLHLKTDISKSISVLKEVLTRVTPQVAYNGIISAAMDVFKTKHKIRCTLIVRNQSIVQEVYEVYGSAVSEIGKYLIQHSRRRVDHNTLTTTLLLMREQLLSGGPIVQEAPAVVQPLNLPERVTTTPAPITPAPTPAAKPKVSKHRPLTTLDDIGRKKPRKEPNKVIVPVTAKAEDKILTEKELGILIQRGFTR